MSKLYHFQYINLVFFTSFQFINLSNLALWVNNRCKWITAIFLNLCDNLLYYMICFFLLSLLFVFLLLFISLSLSCLLISDPHPVPLLILWIYYALPAKFFPNFTIFFYHLFLLLPNYQSTNNQIYSLSLSLSLSNIRESHKHRVTERHKAKKKKKKKNHHRHRFNSQSPT